jgi:intracellular sulfur oxidation DsrE/DsrF family protein
MRQMLYLLLLTASGLSCAQPEVERLMVQVELPVGVVFEIVEGEEDALAQALPRVMRLSGRLRERFPGLPIAVVTHGREQFGLLTSTAQGEMAGIHAGARDLVASDIDLHVCGVHAGWHGHAPEDFPSYVDVSASGPAQIRDYENLGYEVVQLQIDDQ